MTAPTFIGNLTGNAATASNASLLNGRNWTDAVGANTIVTREASGYSFMNYINSNTSNNENPSISQVIVTNGGDNYYRKSSIANFTNAVQSNASGTWGINVTGNAATATTAATANAVSFNG